MNPTQKQFSLNAERPSKFLSVTSGQFFVCPVFNELILAGKKITTHHLPDGAMNSLGTPEDVDLFLKELGAQQKKRG